MKYTEEICKEGIVASQKDYSDKFGEWCKNWNLSKFTKIERIFRFFVLFSLILRYKS